MHVKMEIDVVPDLMDAHTALWRAWMRRLDGFWGSCWSLCRFALLSVWQAHRVASCERGRRMTWTAEYRSQRRIVSQKKGLGRRLSEQHRSVTAQKPPATNDAYHLRKVGNHLWSMWWSSQPKLHPGRLGGPLVTESPWVRVQHRSPWW